MMRKGESNSSACHSMDGFVSEPISNLSNNRWRIRRRNILLFKNKNDEILLKSTEKFYIYTDISTHIHTFKMEQEIYKKMNYLNN